MQTRGMLSFAVFFLLWYVPFINDAFWGLVLFIANLAGVPLQLVQLGLRGFQFWVK
jgi:hypothetical protein